MQKVFFGAQFRLFRTTAGFPLFGSAQDRVQCLLNHILGGNPRAGQPAHPVFGEIGQVFQVCLGEKIQLLRGERPKLPRAPRTFRRSFHGFSFGANLGDQMKTRNSVERWWMPACPARHYLGSGQS